MRHSQRGITFIGWLVLLVPVAIVVYAGIRLIPDVSQLHARLEGAVADCRRMPRASSMSNAGLLRTSLEKNFDIAEHRASDAQGYRHPPRR